MFSPEENQISICLLKSNLEDIEKDLVEQRSAWPELDSENEQKCRDSINALRVARALSSELEKLNHENDHACVNYVPKVQIMQQLGTVKLVAKRMQLKRQSDELGRALERALKHRTAMEDELKCEEQQIETQVRKYEDLLCEQAERFRKTRGYYNEAEINGEIAKVNSEISRLEDQVISRRSAVEELRKQFDELEPDVPEDLLNLIGQNEMNEKLKIMTEKCALLQLKKDKLRK